MSGRVGLVAACGAALLGNTVLLLNRGIFWDAWLYHTQLVEGDWGSIVHTHMDAGVPTRLWFYALAGVTSDPTLTFRLLAIAVTILFAIIVQEVLVRALVCSRGEAAFVGAFAAAYPALHVLASEVNVALLADAAFFFVGAWLILLADLRRGVARLILRIAAVAALVLAFDHEAVLAYAYGLLACVALTHASALARSPRSAWGWIVAHADLLALPVAYFIAHRALLPQRDLYANQYSIHIELVPLSVLRMFAYIVAQVAAIGDAIVASPLWAGAFIALAVLAAFALSRGPDGPIAWDTAPLRGAIAWLLVTMLPYAAVGKSAEVWGWDARHALLLPVPLALVIVGFARPLARRVPPRTLAVAAAVVIGAMALTAERAHLAWEGRWAKDLAFIDALRSEPVLRDRSVLIVRDELPLVPGDVYRSYELTAMAHAAWGGRARAVLREGDPLLTEGLSAFARREYLMDEFHDDGCRTVIVLRPVGAVRAAVALGADYVRAELAGSPAAADTARPLLRMESMPLPGPRCGDTQ